jgi:hypothetical protein
VNFIEPSTVAHGQVRIVQETSYPAAGEVVLRVVEAPLGGVRLQVRCPPWTTFDQVLLNEVPTGHVFENGYVRLLEPLCAGDAMRVRFPIGLRVEPREGLLGSLWWGPLLMTCESPGGPALAVVVPPADARGLISLPVLDTTVQPYAIVGTHFAVIGTGNPVSGPIESLNTNQPQLSRLRPLADQTGLPAPPPSTLCTPIVVAADAGLKTELAHLLGDRRWLS